MSPKKDISIRSTANDLNLNFSLKAIGGVHDMELIRAKYQKM